MAKLSFSSLKERNSYIENQSINIKGKDIGEKIGLSKARVNQIRNNTKINRIRKYKEATCLGCNNKRKVRSDNNTQYCPRCSIKNRKKNEKLLDIINVNCIKCDTNIEVYRRTWIRGTKMCKRCRSSITSKRNYGEATFNTVYRQYASGAKRKGNLFNLSKKEFIEITKRNCFYCDSRPSNVKKSNFNNGDFVYNGIDRIDNDKGYIITNVVPCCKICNYAKNTMTLKEFYDWLNKVYFNLSKEGVLNESSNYSMPERGLDKSNYKCIRRSYTQ